MKRFHLGFVFVLLLAACTGTISPSPNVLLMTGYTDAEGGKVALIDTATLAGILPESIQTLPAPPVAYDVVERARDRGELVALSRMGVALNSPAFLSFFATADINPANPVDFGESRPPVALGPELPVSPEVAARLAGQPINFCPIRVQISAAGRFAAVLNDNRGTCNNLATLNNVVIIDLLPPGPVVVGFFDVDVLSAGLYLSQSFGEVNDRLYWYQAVAVGARIVEVSLPRLDITRTIADVPLDLGNPVTDLSALGATFFALRGVDFLPVLDVPANPNLAEAVPTNLTNARRLVLDPLMQLPNVLVIGSERVAVHLSREDLQPQHFSVSGAVDGTIDSARFAYFVSPGAITSFDLLLYEPTLAPPSAQRFPIAGLDNPAFISWVPARVEQLPR